MPLGSTVSDAITSNDYFTFTATAQVGASFTATGFAWRTTRSATGPSNFVLRSSADNFTSDLAAWETAGTGNLNLSNALNITSSSNVVFRLYGFNTSGNAGTFRVTDGANFGATGLDVTLFGTATAGLNPPEVIVTTADDTVPFATTTYDIAGTANANTVGELTWTNALAGVGGTIPVAANWSIPGIAISVGANVISVRGTNDVGAASQGSVTITREASPPPSVVITTLSQTVPNATTAINVDGTSNADTVGQLNWTNALTGASGVIAAALNWTVPGVALDVGANLITVQGSNIFGSIAQASITVTREVFLPPVGTNTQFFQGFEPGDSWTIIAGDSFIDSDIGATDTPSNSRVRTGANSWQSIGTATNNLDLAHVNITGKTNVAIRVRLASLSGTSGNGADVGDFVRFSVALDGAAFGNPELVIRGNANARWDFNALLTGHRIVDGSATVTNAAPQGGGNSNNYATVILYIPSSATSVALRVTAINNDVNEIWAVDDIELLSSDIGGAGPGPINPVVQTITAFAMPGGVPTVTLGGSELGVNYHFRYTTNLLVPSHTWTLIGSPVAGTGAAMIFTDPSPADPVRAYHVEAISP